MQRLLRTTAVVVGATGATVGAAYGVLSQQGRRARRDIVIPGWLPLQADVVYPPDGTGPHPPSAPVPDAFALPVLRLMMLGDSLAAGLGVDQPEQLPGVVLARGLAKIARYDAGRLTVTELDAHDFAESGAEESYSEGVIDHLRAVEGTAVAALVRARISDIDGDRARKVSLRASDERVDVSAIARAQGGGGHRQAAGFSTTMNWDEVVAFLREEVAQQLAATSA